MSTTESISLRTTKVPAELMPDFPGNRSSLELCFAICYQTKQKVMCITETGSIIPWSTWTNNDEYSSETFLKSNLDYFINKHDIFCFHLRHELNILGIESDHHESLIRQIIDKVRETIPEILQQKVLGFAVKIVSYQTHYVPESELILEASRLEFERENYGMKPTSKDWVERVLMNSEKVASEKEKCAICFEEIVEIGVPLPCDHLFHKNCIKEWLLRSHLCPLCRFEMPVETST